MLTNANHWCRIIGLMGSKPVKIGEDQRAERFIRTLNRDYRDDETCMRIAADAKLAGECATIMGSYVSPELTERLYEERKASVGAYRAKLVQAIDGFEAAALLYRHRDSARAAGWLKDAAELQAQVPGTDELLDVKRHGRHRDHGILYSARQTMEKALGPISYETLANLINASAEAQGIHQEPATGEMVRKNLENYLDRNKSWDGSQGNSDPLK
jgi:hypothetical protein